METLNGGFFQSRSIDEANGDVIGFLHGLQMQLRQLDADSKQTEDK